MKRLAAGLCALGLLSGAAGAVVSEMTPPPPEDNSVVTAPAIDYTNSADILYTLGLFQGVGFDAQGKLCMIWVHDAPAQKRRLC